MAEVHDQLENKPWR